MKTNRLLQLSLAASIVLSFSYSACAQTKSAAAQPAPAGQTQPVTETKKPSAGPFHGKLAAVDLGARSIKVGKRTFYITAETKMHKADKVARLEDGVVGEPCSGYVKPDESGRLIAKSVNFGPKTDTGNKSSKPSAKKTGQ